MDIKRSRFLREIIDLLGRPSTRTEHDETGRLKQIVDVNGRAVDMTYDMSHDNEIVKDQLGIKRTFLDDDRGNILQELDAKGIVTRGYRDTYDSQQNLLTVEEKTRRLHAYSIRLESQT